MKKAAKTKRPAPAKQEIEPAKQYPVTVVDADGTLPLPNELVKDAGIKTGDKFAYWNEGSDLVLFFSKLCRGKNEIPKYARWNKIELHKNAMVKRLFAFKPIPETLTDGWRFGSYTRYADPKGCSDGDGFVIAPDGQRAELDWVVGTGKLKRMTRADKRIWGVFEIGFPRPVKTTANLVENFRAVLPQIKAAFARHQKRRRAK